MDAYITDNNEIVLGAKRLRPQMPGENISWKQIVERPNTIAGYGIKDAYIAERLEGTINEKNLPARLQIELASQQYADGIDVKVEALKTISYENFIYLFDENSARKAKISAIEQDVNSTKNSVSKNAEKIKLLQKQAGDNAAQIKSNDVEVEALKTISYENFRYLFDEMKNMADAIALLTKQLGDMQSKLDNIIGSGGSGGTCQCTDEDVQDTDVDQIFN